MNRNDFMELLRKHNAELMPSPSRDRATVYFPKDPGPTVKAMLRDIGNVDMVVGLKLSTKAEIDRLLGGRKLAVFKEYEGRVEADVDADVSEVWDKICEAMQKDGYAESWRIGNLTWDPKVAKAVEERPQRNAPIDLIDVKIEINELEMLMNQPKE